MQVEFIDSMGSDMTVVNAARASFDRVKAGEFDQKDESLLLYLARGYSSEDWEELMLRLMEAAVGYHPEQPTSALANLVWEIKTKQTHFQPFAHPQLSFRMTLPLAIARQFWRSHVGASGGDCGYPAWSEKSFRYVDKMPSMFIPEQFRGRAANNKQGSEGFVPIPDDVDLHDLLAHQIDVYQKFIVAGVAPEMARFFLPQNIETTFTWTGSLMFFARLAYLRNKSDAQRECNEVMSLIEEHIKRLFPKSWEALMTGNIL